MALWIDPDSFLTIGHFSESDRVELSKMVHTIVTKAHHKLYMEADTGDLVGVCFVGIGKAYQAYKQNLTLGQCTNYARSEIRNTYLLESNVQDVVSRHELRISESYYIENAYEEENNMAYREALDDLKQILSEREYEIFIDRAINGYSVKEMYKMYGATCTIKTFFHQVHHIMDKTKTYMVS